MPVLIVDELPYSTSGGVCGVRSYARHFRVVTGPGGTRGEAEEVVRKEIGSRRPFRHPASGRKHAEWDLRAILSRVWASPTPEKGFDGTLTWQVYAEYTTKKEGAE